MPNARLVGLGVTVPCVMPVPESAIVRFESDPVEVMEMFPLADPLVVGENVAVNDVICPAFNVKGNDRPLRLNPAPLALAAEIVSVVPPVLVSVSVKFELLPTCTFPNAKLTGLGVSVPWVTPVPERGILRFGLPPFDVTLILPLAAPVALGEKRTVKVVLWPAFNVKGRLNPLKLNPAPLALAAEMVRLDPPELVRVPLSDFDVPT